MDGCYSSNDGNTMLVVTFSLFAENTTYASSLLHTCDSAVFSYEQNGKIALYGALPSYCYNLRTVH